MKSEKFLLQISEGINEIHNNFNQKVFLLYIYIDTLLYKYIYIFKYNISYILLGLSVYDPEKSLRRRAVEYIARLIGM